MKQMIRIGLGALALMTCLATAPAAFAQSVNFKADLKGSSAVPPNQSAGNGSVEAIYDTASKKLSWTIAYSGLSGNATAVHFHGPADAGKNAGIALPIQGSLASPIKDSATLTDAQAADLLGGRWYVNIHTTANPGGELRGQLGK